MKKANGMLYAKQSKTKNTIVKCTKCGNELTPDQACYYVDGCNFAITNSSPPYCIKCYKETYKKQHKKIGDGLYHPLQFCIEKYLICIVKAVC